MIFLSYFLIGFMVIRLCVALSNVLTFPYLPITAPLQKKPKVSILIPARDEETNLGNILSDLTALGYPDLEILVCNDHSEDATENIIQEWMTKNEYIKKVAALPLSKGWLGKNFACHQLAKEATGEVLLFLDADVRIKKGALERAVFHLKQNDLKLLSVFPYQKMESLGEKITVPLMNWILLSLLPLVLIRKSKNPAFAAANGQFMLFDAEHYRLEWPHEKFKGHRVEDIAILQDYKKSGLPCDTRLGDTDINCRMYDGLGAAINGFTKNIFQFFGNSQMLTVVFGLLLTIAPFVVIYAMGWLWSIIYVVGIVSIRFFVSLASQQSVGSNLILALPQHIVFLVIIYNGLIKKKRKVLKWKGRNILLD